MAGMDELIEQLRPLERTTISLTPLADDATLGIQIARVPMRHVGQPVVHKLAALQRLALCDAREWETQVTRLWPTAARALVANRQRAKQHIIGLMAYVDSGGALTRLCDALSSSPHSRETVTEAGVVTIPVHLHLVFITALDHALASIEELMSSSPPHRQLVRRGFHVKRLSIGPDHVRDVQCLAQLTSLAQRGVMLSEFPHLNFDVT